MNSAAEDSVSHTYIVTVTATYTAQMDQVVSSLESSGLRVTKVLGTLGQVIGSAQAQLRAQLESVEGVQSVDEDKIYRLPSPTDPVQ